MTNPPSQLQRSFRTRIADFFKKPTVQQAFEASTWQILTKILSVAATAWAVRCMGPENYGISGMVAATIIQLSLAGTLLSDIYLIRQYKTLTSDAQRTSLVECAFTFRTLCAVISVMCVLPCLFIFKTPQNWIPAILAGIPMLFININMPTWLLTARENVPAGARIQTLNSFIITVIYALFFRPGQSAGSDIAAAAVGGGIAFFAGWRATRQSSTFPFRLGALSLLPGLISQSRWLCATALLSYLYSNLELPLVGYLCSITEAGYYRVATGLSGSLDSLLYVASLIIFPKLIGWHAQGNDLLRGKQKEIGLLVAIPLAVGIPVVFILSTFIIKLLYGQAFIKAAFPFAILTASKALILAGTVFGFGFWARGQDKLMFIMMSACAVINVVGNLVFIPRFGIDAAAIVNLSSNALLTGITTHLVIRKDTVNGDA